MSLRVEAGNLNEQVLVDPADLGDLARRVLLHALGQLVETVAPLLDELVVVQVLVDDDVEHAQRQRRVGAGAQAQPVLGLRREPGELRVDNDQLAPALHRLDQPVAQERIGIAHDRVATPVENALRSHPILICLVAVLAELRHVGHPLVAHDDVAQRRARQHARVARQKAQRKVGAAKVGVLIVGNYLRHVTTGADHRDDGLRATLLLELAHVLLDDVVRLVPADALPLVLAALAGALQRILEPAFMINQLG